MTHASYYLYFQHFHSTKNVRVLNLDQLLRLLHVVHELSLHVLLLLQVLLVAHTVHCGGCLGSLEAVVDQDRVGGDDLNTDKLVLQDKDEMELFYEVIELTNKLTADSLDHLDDSDGDLNNTSEIINPISVT